MQYSELRWISPVDILDVKMCTRLSNEAIFLHERLRIKTTNILYTEANHNTAFHKGFRLRRS